jgi:coenzyme PQQ precursor peptide PqqA
VPASSRSAPEETDMAWKAPKIVEVSLALEINSYACAEVD